MAVRLRLMRGGKKKQPTYRVVAAESSHRRDGRFIEIIGQYDPRQDPSLITIDNTKALRWLRNGAQPSDRVRKLLVISGAWAEFTGEAPPEPVTAPKGRGAAKGAADAAVPPPATATPALVIEDDHPADTPEQAAGGVAETAEPETPEPEGPVADDESEAAAEASAADVEAEVEAADADGATAAEESDAS